MSNIINYPSMGREKGANMSELGKRLRDIRKDHKLTVKQLSELCGVPEKAIYRVETGEVSDPRMSTIVPIICALNCSADEVIFDPKEFPRFGQFRQILLKFGELEDFQQEQILETFRLMTLGMSFETYLSDQMAAGNFDKVTEGSSD